MRNEKGQFVKGVSPWNKGKEFSAAACEKMRQAKLKNPVRYWLGKKGHPAWNLGVKGYVNDGSFKKGHSPTYVAMREKNPSWNGGSSGLPYDKGFSRTIREAVRRRDNYRCQQCFRHQDELFNAKGKRYKLVVHHVDYNKKNSLMENLISLCRNCHSQTNFKRQDWINYFKGKVVLT
jgi:5-methylcytosine-specific restriction endonuclease McrA